MVDRQPAPPLERILGALSETPILVYGRDGRFVTAYGFQELQGEPIGDLVGRSPHDYLSPDEAEARLACVREVFATGESREDEVTFAIDGQPLHYMVNYTPLVEDGEVTHVLACFRDVTANRRATAALHESEELFRQLAESTDHVFWLASYPDWEFLYLNPAYERIWGQPIAEAMESPTSWAGLVHPDDRERLIRVVLELAPVEGFHETFRIVRPDAEERWLRARGFPVRDVHGRTFRLAGLSEDITERKRADDALRESEERFRQLAENIREVFWLLDWDEQRVIYVSPAYEAIWGRPVEYVYENPGRAWEVLHPDDRDRVRKAFFATVAKGDFDVTYRLLRPDGSERWIHDRGFPIRNAQGRVWRVAGIAEDVTEQRDRDRALRESELRFRQLAENIDAIFWIADARTGDLVYVNSAYERVWGRNADELRANGERWLEWVHPDDREKASTSLARQMKDGAVQEDYRILRPDGEARWIRGRAFPVRDGAGAVVRIVGIAEDVTERRQFEARMEQAQKLESLGVLAGGIAHDFNNLLTGILGNASLALESLEPESPAHAMIHEIDKAARRAADLCAQMLAYSGRSSLVVRALDLSALVKRMHSLLRASTLGGTAVEYHLGDPIPSFRGDATQIGQIVLNLVTNAVEALEDGGGAIRVSTGSMLADARTLRESYLREELPPGEYVYLEVSDPGCGMDEPTQAKIFEPFFTTKFTGRGLGLAAVLGIVRGHHGALHLESAPGQGTTFRVLFPASEDAAQDEPVTLKRLTRAPESSGTVLVIDDEETVRTVAERILQRAGYKALTAADGPRGLELLAERSDEIEAILLDLTMPGWSGHETLAALREAHRSLPVVLMSGYHERAVTPETRELGYVAFLHKPFTGGELLDCIERALRRGEGEPDTVV